MKKLLSIILALAMVLSLGAGFASAAKDFVAVPWEGPNLSKGLDKEQSEIYIIPEKGNQQPVTGYYVLTFDVDGTERTAKVYIPEVAPIRCYFNVIAVPDGWNTEEFIVKSGWKAIAEASEEALFILEAAGGEGAWGEDEYAYVKTAMGSAGLEGKTFYNLHGVHYLAGYGKGGTALQQWAINTPLKVISAAFIGTEDLSEEAIQTAGARLFGNGDDGFPSSLFYDPVPYAEVPIPVWFAGSGADKLVAYLKNANDCLPTTTRTAYGDTFLQRPDSDRWTTKNCDVEIGVTITGAPADVADPAFTEKVHSFLSYYTRYDNTSVYGNDISVRLQYDDPRVDINNLWIEEDGFTWKREYLVYVPYNCEEIYPDGAPVVYVFAGGSQPDRLFMDVTRWNEIADKYGFIVCVPCSQYSGSANTPIETRWNMTDEDVFDADKNLIRERADDFYFVEKLVEAVDAQYNTDPNRRYATGQSNGSMFSRNLAQRLPQLFAAVGSTSATSDVFKEATTDVIPVYLLYAENDNGGASDTGIKVYDFINNHDGGPYKTMGYWFERNGAVIDDPEHPELNATVESGLGRLQRIENYTWTNKAGIPVYMYGWTMGRSHNNSVDTGWVIWESWFAHWSKTDNGARVWSASAFAEDDAQVLPLAK